MSTERILVHKEIVESFLELFKSMITGIFEATSPVQTLAQSAAVDRNHRLIADALAKGASVYHGDKEHSVSKYQMTPTVVRDVTSQMDIYHIESFGPSVSVITFDTDDEAIRISNDTEYGLSGAVFTQDLGKGLTIAEKMRTGAVHINSMSVHDEAALPHGGVKNSGWGRFNATTGIDEFLQTKVMTFQF
jgi:acyl-CoA reductase-like NAD-dependent aldehyde dehydrogenase